MEAVIQHNESDLSTWIPLEYTENLSYGEENARFSPYLTQLREAMKDNTIEKINKAK
jgi:putative hydrolases of HD superfamily